MVDTIMTDIDLEDTQSLQFTCFSKLPFELRKQIWLEAYTSLAPRTITFSLLICKAEAVPSLLQTCHESRSELMGFYTPIVFRDKSSTTSATTNNSNAISTTSEKRKGTSSQNNTSTSLPTTPNTTTSWWTRHAVLKLVNFPRDTIHIRDGNFLRDTDSPQALRRDVVIARNISRFGGFAKLVRRLSISDFLLERSMFQRKSDKKVDFWCLLEGSFPALEEVVILSYGDWGGLREMLLSTGGDVVIGPERDGQASVRLTFEKFPDT